MKFKILLLLLICTNVYSQTGQKGQETQEPFEEGRSAKSREGRSLQLALGPGIEFGIPAFSYNISYFINPHKVINLRYTDRDNYNKDGGYQNLSAIKLGVKIFAGNSFFYQPNISYRNTSHTTTAEYEYQDINVGVRIGNEWVWDNFTLGIDWLGFNQHIIKIDEEVTPAGPVPANNDIEKSLTFDFVGIYLGYSF
jgi:hypothetical protein